jgi:hypothetical protein
MNTATENGRVQCSTPNTSAAPTYCDTYSGNKTPKYVLNKRHRRTSHGWLRNYYHRLKRRKHIITFEHSAEDFVECSLVSNSFRASWEAYVENNFDSKFSPKFVSSFEEPNKEPAYFYQ